MKPDDPRHLRVRDFDPRDKRPRALVIGSGFGGLAAAIRLSCRGWQVQVLERLDRPGGRARVHEQDGFRFDAGPTIVTVPHLFDELWQLCGRRLEDDIRLISLDPFYRIRFDDGSHFDYTGDQARIREQIVRFCPTDLAGYDRLVEESERCFRHGFESLGSTAFDGIGDLVSAVPKLIQMRAWRTMYRMVARRLRDPRLRMAFSLQPLLIGGNPRAVTGGYSLIHVLERRFGVHWAMGGTGELIRGMVGLLAGRDAPVHCGVEVKRILVEGGRARGVELAGGQRIESDIVVSNADAAWTYRHLVAPEHRRHWTDRRIDRQHYSMSLFVWYFGTSRRYDDVPHHTMVLGPRYEGLLDDIFKHKRLTPDFSIYLHRPTATDPSMAPPGCDTFYALAPVPHLDSGTDWHAEAEAFRERVAERLERTLLPGLRSHLVTSRVTTPQHFHDELLSYKGAAFSLEPRLTQSAYFRPHNRSEDVAGLYLVGAGTHPGAGVPGVLMSAKALESVLPEAATARSFA
jgi:phytoene desaturase